MRILSGSKDAASMSVEARSHRLSCFENHACLVLIGCMLCTDDLLEIRFCDILQAVELLSCSAEITAREKELLRAVPEMEVINAMIGNVKMAMPGLSKIKVEARRSKKKGGK